MTTTIWEFDVSTLIANGYEPVATVEKAAKGIGWTTRPNTVDNVFAEYEAIGGTGIGLRTGPLVCVDIDIWDGEHADATYLLAKKILGKPVMVRVGNKGYMLCYRTDTPIKKTSTPSWTIGNDLSSKVEVLGVGQQFVAFGECNLKTHKEYKWITEATPYDTRLDQLTTVTPEQLAAFLAAVKIPPDAKQKGGKTRAVAHAPHVANDDPVSLAEFEDTLRKVNPGLGYDEWIERLASIYGTVLEDDETTSYALDWCQGKYWKDGEEEPATYGNHTIDHDSNSPVGEEGFNKAWNSFGDPNKKNTAGFGKLKFFARIDPKNDAEGTNYTTDDAPRLRDEERVAKAMEGFGIKPRSVGAEAAAPAGAWEDPVDRFADIPEPLFEPEMVPKVIWDFASDVAFRKGVAPSLMAAASIVVMAAATPENYVVQSMGLDTEHTRPARLWLTIVGESSSRKSSAIDRAMQPLEKLNKKYADLYALDYARWKTADEAKAKFGKQPPEPPPGGDPIEMPDDLDEPIPPIVNTLQHPKPTKRVMVIRSTTIEGLASVLSNSHASYAPLILNDEMSGWMSSMGAYKGTNGKAMDRSEYVKGWNGGPNSFTRAGHSYETDNWSFSILAGIQPNVLRDLLRMEKLDNDGLIQRFLIMFADRAGKIQDRAPDEDAMRAYDQLIVNIAKLDPIGRRVIHYDPAAQAVRQFLIDRADDEGQETNIVALDAHLGKWGDVFDASALTLHIADCLGRGLAEPDPVIPERIALMASRLLRWFFYPGWQRFAAQFFRPQSRHLGLADRIADYLLSHDQTEIVSERDLKQGLRLKGDGFIEEDFYQALKSLADEHWLAGPFAQDKGRVEWRVNPMIWEADRFPERMTFARERNRVRRESIKEAATRRREENGERTWH